MAMEVTLPDNLDEVEPAGAGLSVVHGDDGDVDAVDDAVDDVADDAECDQQEPDNLDAEDDIDDELDEPDELDRDQQKPSPPIDESTATTTRQQSVLHQIRSTEERLAVLEGQISLAKEELKNFKKSYDFHCSNLRSLCRSLTEELPLFDRPSEAETSQPSQPVETVYEETQAAESETIIDQPETPPDDDSWRSVPSSTLDLKSIKGFGKKKQETFLDQCPTLGHIEDLRATASKECVPFSAVLERGLGEAIAQGIEDLLLKFFAERQQ